MTFDHAREYLARVVPWPLEGDAPAYINVHWTFVSEKYDRPGWGGRACKSLNEAIKAVEFALKGEDTRDIYACLSSQAQAQERVSKLKGWTFYTPIRSQSNAVALKALFLDIDCKDGPNGYPDQKAAVAALSEFLTASGMPRPTMHVASGGGLHVYWTLDRALMPLEWKPLALALAEATKKHGLKCDTQCTIDSARILRIPDTFNRKQEKPRPVRLAGSRLDFDYSVERITAALSPFIDAEAVPALPLRTPLVNVNDELSAGIESTRAAPTNIAHLAEACPFVNEALATGGKDFTNPLWNLTTLIATFCEDDNANAHRMASQHPGYSFESTNELFERKQKDKDEKGLGWPGCRTISATGASACSTCPHAATGKTPFHFVSKPHKTIAPSQPQNWDVPNGYMRDPDGIVHRIIVQQDGSNELVPVLNYPMIDPWLQKNPWILNFTTTAHKGSSQQIAMPFAEALTQGGCRSTLSRQGLTILPGRTSQMFEEFIVSWIQKLQAAQSSIVNSAPFGWNIKSGKIEGFIYGGQVWTPAGGRPSAVGDMVIAASYTPTGTADAWKNAAELITDQDRPALNAIIASAFGAPLVRFTGQSGLMMSTYSAASGIGKTTALKVAQAVWGDPIKAMQGLSDTQLSVLNKIGQIRSLPLYWDELKTEDDTKKFVNLMFQLTSGKERSRMSSDVTQRSVGTWQTMLVSASNESIIDYVVNRTKMTTAGVFRTFEYEVERGSQGQIEGAEADQILSKLHDNYGHVGLQYSQFLGENFEQVEIEVAEFRKQISIEVKAQNDERFWTAAITIICMGARYSNRLGFTQINEEELKQFMLRTLQGMREQIKAQPNDMANVTNVENVLAQYLNAMRARHTLWTDIILIAKGRPSKDAVKVVRDASKLEDVYVHIAVNSKIMRISSTHFSDWLKEKGYSRHMFTRALEKDFSSKNIVGRIGGGTQYAVASNEYLIEIHLAGTSLAAFLENE